VAAFCIDKVIVIERGVEMKIDVQKQSNDLALLLVDCQASTLCKPDSYDDSRRWSYGDVENNGVFYHPQLTHYAHQAFEQFFYSERRIHYSDLSGRENRHRAARDSHVPTIMQRMTFPIGWLHQWMDKPMYAGDLFHTWIDTVSLPEDRVGVRAHVFDDEGREVALVIWVRWAIILDPAPRKAQIPDWFPGRNRPRNRS
jgi:hypothetical protein